MYTHAYEKFSNSQHVCCTLQKYFQTFFSNCIDVSLSTVKKYKADENDKLKNRILNINIVFLYILFLLNQKRIFHIYYKLRKPKRNLQ